MPPDLTIKRDIPDDTRSRKSTRSSDSSSMENTKYAKGSQTDALETVLGRTNFLSGNNPTSFDVDTFAYMQKKGLKPNLMSHPNLFVWSTFMYAYTSKQ